MDETCGNCLHFTFKGLEWHCKLEDKKIKHWGKKCKDWVSLTQKKPLGDKKDE